MSVSWSGSWTLWRRCHTGQAHFKSRNPIPKVRMCTEFGKEGTEERVAVAGRNPRELESQRAGMPTEGFLSPSRVFGSSSSDGIRTQPAPSPHPPLGWSSPAKGSPFNNSSFKDVVLPIDSSSRDGVCLFSLCFSFCLWKWVGFRPGSS